MSCLCSLTYDESVFHQLTYDFPAWAAIACSNSFQFKDYTVVIKIIFAKADLRIL